MEQTPPLTLQQYRNLHLVTEHIGRDKLDSYVKKFDEVDATWARIYPPGKAITPGKDLPETEKRSRLLYSGDGWKVGTPRLDWHDFKRRWQHGAASLVELGGQVEQINEVLAARKEPTLEALPARDGDDAGNAFANAARFSSLESEVASLRSENADLRGANANLASAVDSLTKGVDKLALDLDRLRKDPVSVVSVDNDRKSRDPSVADSNSTHLGG